MIASSKRFHQDRPITAVEPISCFHETVGRILAENQEALRLVDAAAVDGLIQRIRAAPRLFAVGEGRSGLVIRMAAMRMIHLGREAHVVGEATAPAIAAGDLLLAISGSGTTRFVVEVAESARKAGAAVVALTTQAGSPLAREADFTVILPAACKLDHGKGRSRQFAGSQFEQASLILWDAIFDMMARENSQGDETLWSRHTNLE